MAILLTQSQVSVALSTSIVAFFTLLLFLSGYTLQRQSTDTLREAVKPRIPSRPTAHAIAQQQQQQPLAHQILPSRLFGGSIGSNGRVAYQKYYKPEDNPSAQVDWQKLAHVQLVKTHHDVCNAIMVFGELHRLKSPARRVLMFPRQWAVEAAFGKGRKGDTIDPYMDSSRRLLRLAARRYGVELRPVSPVSREIVPSQVEGEEGQERDIYSLASAFSLTDFTRVLALETPGLLRDAQPLDAVLAFTEPTPFAMLHDTVTNDGVHNEDLFLLTPSSSTQDKVLEHIAAIVGNYTYNDSVLASAFPEALQLASSDEDSALVRSIGVLHDATPEFNQTSYLKRLAYIRFWDPKLPGPEYDIPWSMKRDARPKNKDADWVWTKLYGTFAQKRMEMCGLDLEHWSA